MEKREISFEWEAMLGAFYIKYAETMKRMTHEGKKHSIAARESAQAGDMAAILTALKTVSHASGQITKTLR